MEAVNDCVRCRSLAGTLIIWLHIVMAVKAGFGLLQGSITAGVFLHFNPGVVPL